MHDTSCQYSLLAFCELRRQAAEFASAVDKVSCAVWKVAVYERGIRTLRHRRKSNGMKDKALNAAASLTKAIHRSKWVYYSSH